jgi:hypothetical protein
MRSIVVEKREGDSGCLDEPNEGCGKTQAGRGESSLQAAFLEKT